MKLAFFTAEMTLMAIALPFSAVATLTSGITIGLVVLSHAMHLRGDRWGRE